MNKAPFVQSNVYTFKGLFETRETWYNSNLNIKLEGVLIMSTKAKKIIAGVIAVILVLAMVVPMVLAGF